MDNTMGWIGFLIGLGCMLLAAAAYRISWEWPDATQTPAVLETAAPPPAPVREPKVMPLEPMDSPPEFIQRQREQQRAAAAQMATTADPESASPPALRLRRDVAPRLFTPGESVEVAILIEKQSDELPSDVELEEMLPTGWQFVELLDGPAPDSAPESGAGGRIQFTWKGPDNFPIALRYKVVTNPDETRAQAIRGSVAYQIGNEKQRTPLSAFPVRPAQSAQ